MDEGLKNNYLGSGRQIDLYGRGGAQVVPVAAEELERRAQIAMSPEAFDFVAGGAGREDTLRSNLAAFQRRQLAPRMLRDTSRRSLGIELLGAPVPAPVLLAPIGVQEILHEQAECGSARAAAAVKLPFVLSTVSSRTLEDVAAAMDAVQPGAARWFQLYWGRRPELTAHFLKRAEASGYGAIVVTLDTPMLGWRERDLDRGYMPFLRGYGLANFFSDPVFCAELRKPPAEDRQAAIAMWAEIFSNPTLTWSDLGWLRRQTRLPIVLKGILRADDARHARDAGADGIIVSNHGGRQVDGAIAALDALPEVVSAVGNEVAVLVDGGIRRGADAIKALAMGAQAVLIGRLYAWGLAVGGETGVREVLANFLGDFDLTLALCGCSSIAELRNGTTIVAV